jgi:uncharacterized radical SAM superfamily Fe-S cluster-containing enzyme
MINTNGLRIAREPDFVARLAENKRGLEVYLQFDSLERDALINLRGADLRKIRQQALENLERYGVSTTLVATVKRGVNDHEIGDIVRHALTWKCVRGVTFQPCRTPAATRITTRSATASCCRRSGGAWSRPVSLATTT